MIQAIYLNQDKQMIIKFQETEKIAPLSLGKEVLKTLCIQNGATYIWKFMVHILLKPGLENFEHYFTSV